MGGMGGMGGEMDFEKVRPPLGILPDFLSNSLTRSDARCRLGADFSINYNTTSYEVYLADARWADDDDLCVEHVQHRRS